MVTRVGINGYGRIGRNFHRVLLKQDVTDVQLVAINDVQGSNEHLAKLLQYDSVGGTLFDHNIVSDDNHILVNGSNIARFEVSNPAEIPWHSQGVDVVIDSTGLFASRAAAEKHLEQQGVKRVIISAPASDADLTICMGVNDFRYDPDRHHVVSNASCTTNCLAPMAAALHASFGIVHGLINTVHAYTGDQALHDTPKSSRSGKADLRRMRAAAENIIPNSTGAAKAIGLVNPELSGLLDGLSLRVPVKDGSITDLTAVLRQTVTKEQVNDALRQFSKDPNTKGVFQVTDDELVSGDILGNPASCIASLPDTMVIAGNMVKVLGWYDNEWGYSNRLVDLVRFMTEKGL